MRSAFFYPRAAVDGVEIDPAVSRVGRRYFGMGDNPRLVVHDADARPFLRSTDTRYDLIVVDAYHQPYVPFYLATREFFRLVREHLAPGGIVVLNVATVPGDKRLVRAVGTTLSRSSRRYSSGPRCVSTRSSSAYGAARRGRACAPTPAQDRGARLAPELLATEARPVVPSGRAWTDDRAPVEWVTDRMIVTYAAEGGRLHERDLPTEPTLDRAAPPMIALDRHVVARSTSGIVEQRSCAREHARVVSRRRGGRRRPDRVRRHRVSSRASSSSRTRTISAR